MSGPLRVAEDSPPFSAASHLMRVGFAVLQYLPSRRLVIRIESEEEDL